MTVEELPLDGFDLTEEEVRQRFAWAIRNGKPHWIWPDVSISEWQIALQDIEDVTRRILDDCHSTPVLDGLSAAFGVACYTSGMGPLLGHWRREGKLFTGPELGALLDLHLRHNTIRMDKMTLRAKEAVSTFANADIPVTILKGTHTAVVYFPAIGARPMSDIDLLVSPEDEPRAAGVLKGLGYEPGLKGACPKQQIWQRPGRREPMSLCFVHADDPWSVDLQVSLNRQYAPGAPIISLDSAEALREPISSDGLGHATTLGQPLLTLQLACHASTASGLFSLTLLRLVELVLVIRKDNSRGCLDWDAFLDIAKQTGAMSGTYAALSLCENLAPGTIPQMLQDAIQEQTPKSVRRVISKLTPGTAQQMARCSFEERLMWSRAPDEALRQLFSYVRPSGVDTVAEIATLYRDRARRLFQGYYRR